MSQPIRTADSSTIRLLDGILVAWLAVWLTVGIWSGYTIWHLSDLGDTVSSSGRALGSAGEALQSLGSIPVVGERPGELGRQTVTTGAEITLRGQEVKGQLRQLSLLLGLAICLIPTTPVVGLYLPLRLSRGREVNGLRRALRDHGDDEGFDRYLAERALRNLPYADVQALVGDPWRAISEGRSRELADAELARLGVRRG
jgi:hypothetical protein